MNPDGLESFPDNGGSSANQSATCGNCGNRGSLVLGPLQKIRLYFFNSHNDDGQNWGQGSDISTQGNGELYGEALLPVTQFALRLYVFHYDHSKKTTRPMFQPAQWSLSWV